MNAKLIPIVALAWLGLASVLPIIAQESPELMLDWSGINGGGGWSSGGDFSIASSVGLPASGTSSGGDYSVVAGFYSGSIVTEPPVPEAVPLQVALADGGVILSWPADGTEGFLLEETASLTDGANWALVNGAPQTSGGITRVHLIRDADHRFYRLRKP